MLSISRNIDSFKLATLPFVWALKKKEVTISNFPFHFLIPSYHAQPLNYCLVLRITDMLCFLRNMNKRSKVLKTS